jgi:hypothetical protein
MLNDVTVVVAARSFHWNWQTAERAVARSGRLCDGVD